MAWTLAAAAVVSAGTAAYNAYDQHQTASHYKNQGDMLFHEQQDYAQQLKDLMKNPSSVTSLPGYDFRKQEGEQSLERQMAAGGYLGSGNMGTALVKYGQDYATGAYDDQVKLLAQLSGLLKQSSPTEYAAAGQKASAASYDSAQDFASTLAFMGNKSSFGGAASSSSMVDADSAASAMSWNGSAGGSSVSLLGH